MVCHPWGDPCLDTSVCLVGFLRLPVVPAGVSGKLVFCWRKLHHWADQLLIPRQS